MFYLAGERVKVKGHESKWVVALTCIEHVRIWESRGPRTLPGSNRSRSPEAPGSEIKITWLSTATLNLGNVSPWTGAPGRTGIHFRTQLKNHWRSGSLPRISLASSTILGWWNLVCRVDIIQKFCRQGEYILCIPLDMTEGLNVHRVVQLAVKKNRKPLLN